jgi:hypothetical protein
MVAVGMHLTWVVVVLLSMRTHHVVTALSLQVEAGSRPMRAHQGKWLSDETCLLRLFLAHHICCEAYGNDTAYIRISVTDKLRKKKQVWNFKFFCQMQWQKEEYMSFVHFSDCCMSVSLLSKFHNYLWICMKFCYVQILGNDSNKTV